MCCCYASFHSVVCRPNVSTYCYQDEQISQLNKGNVPHTVALPQWQQGLPVLSHLKQLLQIIFKHLATLIRAIRISANHRVKQHIVMTQSASTQQDNTVK